MKCSFRRTGKDKLVTLVFLYQLYQESLIDYETALVLAEVVNLT